MKRLAIGTQSFEKLINNDSLYIDKSRQIYQLVTEGNSYFLSRPRRFGKSLLLSTLESLFSGEKELFKDLWIAKSDYNWKKFPVIKINMPSCASINSENSLDSILQGKLQRIACKHGIELKAMPAAQMLENFILSLSAKGQKVVILIDDYDRAIVDHIGNPETLQINRVILKDFYSVLRELDEHIHFSMLVGITNLARVSLFSNFSNLNDISLHKGYGSILGFTHEELLSSFNIYLNEIGLHLSLGRDTLMENIHKWYGSYRFGDSSQQVYNPWSILKLMHEQEFKDYWFNTGSISLMAKLIRESNYSLSELESPSASSGLLNRLDLNNMGLVPLMYQTGYLSINNLHHRKNKVSYDLAYPNLEVEQSFIEHMMHDFLLVQTDVSESFLRQMIYALKEDHLGEFFEILKEFISEVSSHIVMDNDAFYQNMFYLILKNLNQGISAQVSSSSGRIDAILETSGNIYVLEIKLHGSKEDALNQIKEQAYFENYIGLNKEINLIGVAFDMNEHQIKDWFVEAQAGRSQLASPHPYSV